MYIKENLDTTLFESYDAAVAEWENLETAQIKDWQENKEYYNLRKKITQRWGVRMLADVGDEIEKEYPEKFKLVDFK